MVIFLALTFVVFTLLIFSLKKSPAQPKLSSPTTKNDDLSVWPFEPMPIMIPTEIIFFNKLQQALPELLIFGQVQLSRIIRPNPNANQQFWFNRICRMSIDYVLVAPDKKTVLAAIELDDWTHNSARRQQQDNKKDKALSCAGIPILRFHGEAMPNVAQLRQQILQTIS